nr:hypothetical protein [Tanacetum cinerariifolium]
DDGLEAVGGRVVTMVWRWRRGEEGVGGDGGSAVDPRWCRSGRSEMDLHLFVILWWWPAAAAMVAGIQPVWHRKEGEESVSFFTTNVKLVMVVMDGTAWEEYGKVFNHLDTLNASFKYTQMMDYALWDVIENDSCLPKTQVVEGVTTLMPITCVEDKAQRRFRGNAATKKTQRNLQKHQYENFTASSSVVLDQTFDRLQKLISQVKIHGESISQEDVNQNFLRSLSPEWNTHTIVWRNKHGMDTLSLDDLYNNLNIYEPDVKGTSNSNSRTQNTAFVSSSNNNNTNATVNTAQAVNIALGVSTSDTQVNTDNIDNLSYAVMCAFLACQPNGHVDNEGQKVLEENRKETDCQWECRAPKSQDTKHKESTRRTVHMETPTLTALVSCDGLGGYDWSDQDKEGPNYALMAYTSTSSDSKKLELTVLGYKSGLDSVEERLKFFKTNESVYIEDIKLLKVEIQMKGIAIVELRKKLEETQKEKDGIQITVEKLENASKSLNKLIDCQIVDNCKKWLGYESYNAVPPPYTGNFIPPKPELSYIGLDEFADKPIVENCDAKTSETKPKDVRKNNNAPIIKKWVSDDEKVVTQPKIEQKTVKHSIPKIKFV